MQVILAQPRGFCAGVERAIDIVQRAVTIYGAPIYVRHEIVHNKYVVDNLKAEGVVFVDELAEVPQGGIVIFSAHGVSEQVEKEAGERGFKVIDATCPLVTKVHKEAQNSEKKGKQIILIGHRGHPEVEGTSGRVKEPVLLVQSVEEIKDLQVKDPLNLAYVTQTTLSVDDTREIVEALQQKFPAIEGPQLRDICYATQNRQNAVRQLAGMVEMLLVIGAQNSSNSNRLRDLGEEMGTPSYLISGAQDIDIAWLQGKETIGITAGASAPETLTRQVIEFLRLQGDVVVKTMDGKVENTRFKLPKEVLYEEMMSS